jgi:L-lactate dehydrogenase complex protein LldG
MSSRDEILAKVRAAIGTVTHDTSAIPRAYRSSTQDGIEAFLERLAHYDARAIHTTAAELDATVGATLKEREALNIIAPDGVPAGWLTTVNSINDTPPLDNDALDGADGVVTTCALAIAQTGTIILDAGPGMGRRALTLLPDYHLCVVRTEQIVASVPEAIAALDPTRPLTFISGPSATVDIEMVRVKGVHGPRTLDVILVTAHE